MAAVLAEGEEVTPPLPLPTQPQTALVRAIAFVRRADAKPIAVAALVIAALCFFGVTASDFADVGAAKNAALRILSAASEPAPMVVGSSGP